MADGHCLLFPLGISSFILGSLVTLAQVRLSALHCPALDAKQAYVCTFPFYLAHIPTVTSLRSILQPYWES